MGFLNNIFGSKSDKKKEEWNDLFAEVRKSIKEKGFLDEINKAVFPNGQIDIDYGTEEVLYILQNKVPKLTAENIFIKSAEVIFVLQPDERTCEQLKKSLEPVYPNLLSDKQYQVLFNYLVARSISFMLGGTNPKRDSKGGYSF